VRKPPDCGPPNTLKSPEGDKWCKWSVVSGCSLTPIASSPSPASGCLISIESLVGSEGQHTQKGACLGRSSEFTFPLVAGGHRRAADRLTEPRDGSIGSFALGDTFGPNLVGFRVRLSRNKPDLLEKVGIETNAHLESTCKRACAAKKTTRPLYAHRFPMFCTYPADEPWFTPIVKFLRVQLSECFMHFMSNRPLLTPTDDNTGILIDSYLR
jgi:hypothetical protein